MIPILTLLMVLSLSLLTVRVATVALMLTGISRSLARFQARSAFTTCGFTSNETEAIVNHPVRRRIIGTLMLLGNAGIVTTVGAIVAGFAQAGPQVLPWYWRYGILLGGLAVLALLTFSKFVDRILQRLIAQMLRRYTDLDVRDYANVLHISGEYGLGELQVRPEDWLAGKALREVKLSREGVLVLGITRGGNYIGTPDGDFVFRAGDELLLYGTAQRLREIDQRKAGIGGALAHADAVAEKRERAELEAMGSAKRDVQPAE